MSDKKASGQDNVSKLFICPECKGSFKSGVLMYYHVIGSHITLVNKTFGLKPNTTIDEIKRLLTLQRTLARILGRKLSLAEIDQYLGDLDPKKLCMCILSMALSKSLNAQYGPVWPDKLRRAYQRNFASLTEFHLPPELFTPKRILKPFEIDSSFKSHLD